MLSVGEYIAVSRCLSQKLFSPTLIEFITVLLNEADDITLTMVCLVSQQDILQFTVFAVVRDAASADVQSVYQFLGAVHPFTSQVKNAIMMPHIQVID